MAYPLLKDTAYQAATRQEAVQAMLHGENARHDHDVNPLVYLAARELITRDDHGQATDIKAFGLPADVLEQVTQQLRRLGVSAFTTGQIQDALENYAIGLGADFAREAQAKPLYARIAVTNRKLNDLPDYALTQMTLIDGTRRVDEGISQRVMQATIYGTRTSQTREMSLDTMLASSQKKWLLIYYGSPGASTESGMMEHEATLIDFAQGLGRQIPETVAAAIQHQIKFGAAIPPAMAELVKSHAHIAQILEPVERPADLRPAERTELVRQVAGVQEALTALQTVGRPEDIYNLPEFISAVETSIKNIAADYRIPILSEASIPEPISTTPRIAANDESFHAVDTVAPAIAQMEIMLQQPNLPSNAVEVLTASVILMKAAPASPEAIATVREAVTPALMELAIQPTTSPALYQVIADTLPPVARMEPITALPVPDTLAQIKTVVEKAQAAGQPISPAVEKLMAQIESARPVAGNAPIPQANAVVTLARPDVRAELVAVIQQSPQNVSLPSLLQAVQNFPVQQAPLIQAAALQHVVQAVEAIAGKGPEAQAIVAALKSEGMTALAKPASPVMQQTMQEVYRANPFIADVVMTQAAIREINNAKPDRPVPPLAMAVNIAAVAQAISQSGVVALAATHHALEKMPPAVQQAIATYQAILVESSPSAAKNAPPAIALSQVAISLSMPAVVAGMLSSESKFVAPATTPVKAVDAQIVIPVPKSEVPASSEKMVRLTDVSHLPIQASSSYTAAVSVNAMPQIMANVKTDEPPQRIDLAKTPSVETLSKQIIQSVPMPTVGPEATDIALPLTAMALSQPTISRHVVQSDTDSPPATCAEINLDKPAPSVHTATDKDFIMPPVTGAPVVIEASHPTTSSTPMSVAAKTADEEISGPSNHVSVEWQPEKPLGVNEMVITTREQEPEAVSVIVLPDNLPPIAISKKIECIRGDGCPICAAAFGKATKTDPVPESSVGGHICTGAGCRVCTTEFNDASAGTASTPQVVAYNGATITAHDLVI